MILDSTAKTYDQAFALLAMAWLYRANRARSELADAALTLLSRIVALRRHHAGGFVENADKPYQSNPNMHIFEAALAWCEASPHAEWWTVTDEIAELCLRRLIDQQRGCVREFFDASWSPLPGRAGGIVEPGHQFEWAWLLERWAGHRGDAAAKKAISGLYASGMRGIDRDGIFALDEMDDEFHITRASARLWPQTERLKAALVLSQSATRSSRERYLNDAVNAASALWAYLQTPVPGLWRDKLLPSREFVEEAAPASSLYHIVCAIGSLRCATARSR